MTKAGANRATLLTITLTASFVGCSNNPCREGFTRNSLDQCVPEAIDTSDTGSDTTGFIELPDNCTAPNSIPDDPLQLVARPEEGEPAHGEPFYEMLDLAFSPDEERMYAVGQGGLIVWDLGKSEILGTFPPDGWGRYHHIELISDGLVAITHRSRGVELVDVSGPPESYDVEHFWPLFGAAGMAWVEPYLYVTSQNGELLTLKYSDGNLEPISTIYGLEAPWEFVVDGSRGWIADNILGVVPVDLTDPEMPVLGDEVNTVGGSLDIIHHTNIDGEAALYVATGSSGVQVFSLGEAGRPVSELYIPYSTSIVSVAADEDNLWVVGQEDVAVLEISKAHNPVPLSVEKTPGFGMHVEALGSTAWVADWGHLAIYEVNTPAQAPSMDLSSDTLLFGTSDEATLTVNNRGSQPLNLYGATSNDPRVSLLASTDVVQSGDSASILFSFENDGSPLNSSVCLATDDPDSPTVEIEVSLQSAIQSSIGYGEPAPDFTLTDLDGESHRLSEQVGHPVVLIYFATW